MTGCMRFWRVPQSKFLIHWHSFDSLMKERNTLNSRLRFATSTLVAAFATAFLVGPSALAQGVPAASTTPESDPALRVPELKAGEWFDGNAGGTFGEKAVNLLPRSKRVAVVGFKVIFVNETFARARSCELHARPGYLGCQHRDAGESGGR